MWIRDKYKKKIIGRMEFAGTYFKATSKMLYQLNIVFYFSIDSLFEKKIIKTWIWVKSHKSWMKPFNNNKNKYLY